MEEELHLAKAAVKEENLREKIYSIKILCELILDEKQIQQPVVPVSKPIVTVAQPMIPVGQQLVPAAQPIVSVGQPKKLAVDDEANGDSLFDF
jgi:hypothetical protein